MRSLKILFRGNKSKFEESKPQRRGLVLNRSQAACSVATKNEINCPSGRFQHGEFDPGSGLTLAARLKHASRAG